MTAVLDSPASALVCRNCGAEYPLGPQHACFECFGPLEIGYDKDALARVTHADIAAGPHSIWRYAGLLPVGQNPATRVDSGTGMTPLIRADRLADTAAARFKAGGWTVSSTGNLNNSILSTCAYYDPTSPGAQQAAEQLQQQFPAIKRVKEKFPELPAGPVVIVLAADYS